MIIRFVQFGLISCSLLFVDCLNLSNLREIHAKFPVVRYIYIYIYIYRWILNMYAQQHGSKS